MNTLLKKFISLDRIYKISIVVFIDILTNIFCLWIAHMLRLEKFLNIFDIELILIFFSVSSFLIIFYYFEIYQNLNRYFEVNYFILISKSLLCYSVFFFISCVILNNFYYFPRSVPVISSLIFFIFIIFIRFSFYIIYKSIFKINLFNNQINKTLILGTGEEAVQFAQNLSYNKDYEISGFLTLDRSLNQKIILGKRVYYFEDINQIKKLNISHILICINQIEKKLVNELIIKYKEVVNVIMYTPYFGYFSIHQKENLKENIILLMNRQEVDPDINLLRENTFNKNILITGAGGTIGKEIVNQLIKHNPKNIIAIDHSEYALFNLGNFLKNNLLKNESNIELRLGSVLDITFLKQIFKEFKIDAVYHAAAYKHVNIVEENLSYSIKNNIIGTKNVVDISLEFLVNNFVLVSTDKAVKPLSVMGCTKRICEDYVKSIYLNKKNKLTNFAIIRFGNVLGSSGSVLNTFIKQINNGGPITLTDRRASRYFMSVQEAAQLVIQAGALSNNSPGVYVLEMGNPIKIIDLIESLFMLKNLKLNKETLEGEIKILEVGLNQGEKLHEELFLGENLSKTRHSKIIKANEVIENILEIEDRLKNIFIAANSDHSKSTLKKELLNYFK